MTDLLGHDTSPLGDKRLFMMDMDGTIYNENTLFDGTQDFIRAVEGKGGHCVYITNNSSKSTQAYIEKLDRMGIRTDRDHFCTSTDVTALYILKTHPGELVYCQVTPSCLEELHAKGLRTTDRVTQEATVVLIGNDIDLRQERLRNTCEMLTRFPDCDYIATNADTCCPVSFGYVPDCGSVARMLDHAVHRMPRFMGKPAPDMLLMLMERFSMPGALSCAVGDRMYTDIRSGVNAGIDTVCLLSGESTLQTVLESDFRPTWLLSSIREMADCMSTIHR